MLTLLAAGDPLDHVIQHTAFDLNPGGGFWSFPLISNHILMQVLAAAIILYVVPRAVRQRAGSDEVGRLVPRGWGNAIEAICLTLRGQIFEPNLGKYTDIFAPYLWSLFFFILTSNILGMIPLADWTAPLTQGTFLYHQIGGTSTGNIFVTGTLAAATLILVVYNGLRYHGSAYVAHFFMGPWWLSWFIAILEVAGLGFKAMALCVRLCANMLAGHMILAVLMSFVPAAFTTLPLIGAAGVTVGVIVGCILFNFLEILVAFLHAFIFTTLTAVFLGQAVNIHHDEHHDEDAHGHAHAAGAHH